MIWDVTPSNFRVASVFEAYKNFVMNVATHYAGSRLMEQINITPLGHDLKLAISDNFPEEFTTIRSVGDLDRTMRNGKFGQICLQLGTVQLCTAFEMLFDTISDIYTVSAGKDPIEATYRAISTTPMKLGNKAIKQIRQLHNKLGIWSVLNDDEVLVKLTAIIEARNCIVHSGGRITEARTVERLMAYAIKHNVGDTLTLQDNIFDDFLHYMAIHVVAFIKKLP